MGTTRVPTTHRRARFCDISVTPAMLALYRELLELMDTINQKPRLYFPCRGLSGKCNNHRLRRNSGSFRYSRTPIHCSGSNIRENIQHVGRSQCCVNPAHHTFNTCKMAGTGEFYRVRGKLSAAQKIRDTFHVTRYAENSTSTSQMPQYNEEA